MSSKKNAKPTGVVEVVNRLCELADKAGQAQNDNVALRVTMKGVKPFVGWKNTSLNREMALDAELKEHGRGHRNADRTFTIYSGDGYTGLSLEEAIKLEQDLDE